MRDKETTAWVSADGEYGQDDLVVFHPESLTNDQWEFMTEMKSNNRMGYVVAILDGDLEEVARIHEEYGRE